MPFDLECLYCGKKWRENYFSSYSKPRCGVCNDRNIRIKEVLPHEKIDYYEGCPPYEDKKENKKSTSKGDEEKGYFHHDFSTPWESGD